MANEKEITSTYSNTRQKTTNGRETHIKVYMSHKDKSDIVEIANKYNLSQSTFFRRLLVELGISLPEENEREAINNHSIINDLIKDEENEFNILGKIDFDDLKDLDINPAVKDILNNDSALYRQLFVELGAIAATEEDREAIQKHSLLKELLKRDINNLKLSPDQVLSQLKNLLNDF